MATLKTQPLDPRRRVILPKIPDDANMIINWGAVTARQLERETQDILSRLSEAHVDLTALNGEIATNTSDISSLETRVTTNEGDIATNQGDISTIETAMTNRSGRRERTVALALATGVPTKPLLDTIIFNNNMTTINTGYDLDVAGVYMVTAHAVFAANAAGERLVQILQAGTVRAVSRVSMNTHDSNTCAVTCSTIIQGAVGEDIEWEVAQTSGGNLNLTSGHVGITKIPFL